MVDKKKHYIKIFVAILGAFFLAGFLSKEIFMANTPRVNKVNVAKLLSLPGKMLARLTQRETTSVDIKKYENIPLSSYNRLAEGVYAYDDKEQNVSYIRTTGDIQWEDRQINYQGKTITIKVPKGAFQ